MRRELAGRSRTIERRNGRGILSRDEVFVRDPSVDRHRILRMPPATSEDKDGPLSIGVEEEFFLVDLEDGSPVPWADQLCASMPPAFRGSVAGAVSVHRGAQDPSVSGSG
jgi:hypothetical protein